MPIVNQSFFVGILQIPNRTSPAVLEQINLFIQRYEPIFLESLLGRVLYASLLANPTTPRMVDLPNGIAGTSYRGLVYNTNQSPIANYIYYQLIEYQATQTTGMGETVPKQDLAVNVSPADKMVRAWNAMSDDVDNTLSFLWKYRLVL